MIRWFKHACISVRLSVCHGISLRSRGRR